MIPVPTTQGLLERVRAWVRLTRDVSPDEVQDVLAALATLSERLRERDTLEQQRNGYASDLAHFRQKALDAETEFVRLRAENERLREELDIRLGATGRPLNAEEHDRLDALSENKEGAS